MTFFCRNDSLSLAEKTTHFRNSSLNDHNSSFFQTEPFFKNPSAEPLKKIKKKANSKKFYSLCKPKAMPSYENSPFKINRLKPLILYNKEENMNRCYSVTKSFSSVKYKNEEVERREIEKKLRDKSDNHICEDEKPKDYIGEKAIIKYKEFYKNLDKILAENSSYGIKNSLLTEMLSRLEKKTLLPLKMGVIKLKGKSNELNLK